MSFDATAWAWKQAPHLSSSTALVVLLCLADWVGRSGCTRWESQQDIADRCHLSVRAVGDALRTLESEPGLIARSKRYQNQRRIVDKIQLLLGPTMILEGPLPTDEPPTQSADTEPESVTKSADREPESGGLPAAAAGMSSAAAAEQDSSIPRQPAPRPKSRDLSVVAARIFDAAHPTAQRKSGDDPGKVVWALRELLDAEPTVDVDHVADQLVDYYAHPDQQKEGGRYAKAPHRAIADDKWRTWSVGARSPALLQLATASTTGKPSKVEHAGRKWTVPVGGCLDLVGTPEHPGIARQLGWMQDWRENPARWKAHVQGPPPGQEGCRIWPEVLEQAAGGATP